MSTLLLSEWLYQILTTWCRCWQAPRPSAPCCQEPPWNSSQGLFVQLFCLLGPFAAVKTAERERQTERGERESEWWKEKTERDRGRWWTEWDRDWVKEGKKLKNSRTCSIILLFCDGNPVLSNHRHRREYHLAPATAPYLDNAWQKVPWNMNSLHDESHRWDSSL